MRVRAPSDLAVTGLDLCADPPAIAITVVHPLIVAIPFEAARSIGHVFDEDASIGREAGVCLRDRCGGCEHDQKQRGD